MNRFTWDLPGVNGPEFHALSNALRLRSGGQLEPTTITHLGAEEEHESDDDAPSDAPALISDFSAHEHLKKRFLNRLAELAANEKKSGAVACTALRDLGERCVVWAAMNEGYKAEDGIFFKRVGGMLGRDSGGGGVGEGEDEGEGVELDLWTEMVLYYRARLEGFHIPQLRAAFKSWGTLGEQAPGSGTESPAFCALQGLHDVCFGDQAPDQSTAAYHEKLVLEAYQIWRDGEVENLLQKSASKASQNLWLQICFLGRLRAAYKVFKHARTHLPSFGKVDIVCIPTGKKKYPPLRPALSLDHTLKTLPGNIGIETFKNYLPKKYRGSLTKARKYFDISQKSPLFAHAEVQMVLYLTAKGHFDHVFEYLGCSKLSCFTCWHFLRAYGSVATRGCHGQLAKGWTIPEHTAPSKEELRRLVEVVKSARRELERGLIVRSEGRDEFVKQ
ncbi:hypothetical protein FQN54_004189 [Arachnomyces sp. PD_36]|nr:hypothetical protein FQN54_004189 [Arachnomyces sp. PD_36]